MSREKTKGNMIGYRPSLKNDKIVVDAVEYFDCSTSDAVDQLVNIARPMFYKMYDMVFGDSTDIAIPKVAVEVPQVETPKIEVPTTPVVHMPPSTADDLEALRASIKTRWNDQ